MSREAFQAPTLPSGQQQQQSSSSTSFQPTSFGLSNASGGAGGQGNAFEDTSRPVAYLCGDCDTRITLKRGDPIRCKECGYRVLYKERTNRMIQFEAR